MVASLRTRTWLLAALVVAVALVARFGHWAEIRGTALDRWHLWEETDMATYLEQARRIAADDPLAAEPYHPYHGWQKVAPPEQWLAWYGPHAFHQAPAYSYVLAALGPDDDGALAAVKAAQLVLGAGTALLVFLLAARVGGALAGTVAGLAAALYGPLLYLEPQLLREGPAMAAMLALLYATIRVVDGSLRGRARWVAVAALGAGCGLFATFHEMGTVLKIAVALSLLASFARGGWRPAGAALGLFVAGYVVGFAPLLYRNVAVGAPPFAVSCRTAVNFAEANVADAPRGGSLFAAPTPKAIAILDEAQGSFGKAAAGVWRSYEGDLGKLLANWRLRFEVIWQKWEVADNTSYYFQRAVTERLAPMLDFRVVFPAGFAAALAVLVAGVVSWWPRRGGRGPVAALVARVASWWPRRGERGEDATGAPGAGEELAAAPNAELAATPSRDATPLRAAWARSPSQHLVLLLYLLGVAGSLSLVHTVARFRLYLVPFFLIYAGVFVALAVQAARARRWAALALLLALAPLGWWLMDTSTPMMSRSVPRTADYQTAVELALTAGDLEEAERYAESAAVTLPRDPRFHQRIGAQLESDGKLPEAAEHYRKALAINPRIRALQDALRRVTQPPLGARPPQR